MLLIIDSILLFIGLIGILIALISDLKTTEIPDYSNYFLIISGFSLRLLYSLLSNNWHFTLIALKVFPIIFIVSLIMYYTKQWGGGDAKLLMGLSLIFATYPSLLQNIFAPKILFLPFPFILFLNILLIGVIYNLIYSLVLTFKHKKDFVPKFKHTITKTRNTQIKFILLALVLFLSSKIIQEEFISFLMTTIAILSLLLLYLYLYIKTVEKTSLIKTIPLSKLREGDYITHNIYFKNKLLHRKAQDLTQKQISLIKKTNLKKIEIKKGIVFSPVFLIALIASLIFGNLFFYII